MKLIELKTALIEQFFKSNDGVGEDRVEEIITSLSSLTEAAVAPDAASSESHEPSKAFGKFVSGKRAFLTICEQDGHKVKIFFAALRNAKRVSYVDLTEGQVNVKAGSFAQVKEALRQAVALNDDIYFKIASED